jgi:quercetin dioxygenase-like cupin family protein
MKIQSKVWGERWIIRKDDTHCVSFLKLEKGYRCSWHKHQQKYNKFVVTRGKIEVITEELGGKIRKSIIEEGQTLTTRPEQWHEFRAIEDSEVIEEMYVKYDESDIQREILGGKIKHQQLKGR